MTTYRNVSSAFLWVSGWYLLTINYFYFAVLSSVPVEASTLLIKPKTKERCKYFPTCGKGDSCEFHHPTVPCKAFPNCKFADKCMFLHPKCKFDLTCNRVSCNFQHSVPVTQSAAPPLCKYNLWIVFTFPLKMVLPVLIARWVHALNLVITKSSRCSFTRGSSAEL